MLPAVRDKFRIDVRIHYDGVIIGVDLQGVEKGDLSVSLLNPGTLKRSCEGKSDKEAKGEGYCVRERAFGSLSRVVALLHEVTSEG